jgi:hypothetical protein
MYAAERGSEDKKDQVEKQNEQLSMTVAGAMRLMGYFSKRGLQKERLLRRLYFGVFDDELTQCPQYPQGEAPSGTDVLVPPCARGEHELHSLAMIRIKSLAFSQNREEKVPRRFPHPSSHEGPSWLLLKSRLTPLVVVNRGGGQKTGAFVVEVVDLRQELQSVSWGNEDHSQSGASTTSTLLETELGIQPNNCDKAIS